MKHETDGDGAENDRNLETKSQLNTGRVSEVSKRPEASVHHQYATSPDQRISLIGCESSVLTAAWVPQRAFIIIHSFLYAQTTPSCGRVTIATVQARHSNSSILRVRKEPEGPGAQVVLSPGPSQRASATRDQHALTPHGSM